MAGDLEDFLRRAAQRRAENAAVRNEERARGAAKPRRRPEYTDASRERQIAPPEDDDEDVVLVAEIIDEVATGRLAEKSGPAAQRLQSKIAQVDEKVESRLNATFDHEVGRMDQSPAFAGASKQQLDKNSVTAELIELLRNPRGLRQALMLREILDRPTDRWT